MLERLGLIKLLYNNLPKKDQVLTSHQVSRVDYSPKGVYVYCNNGAFFEGDIVVGADGIHSIVRSEMWRQAAKTDPHAFEIKDKACEFHQPPPLGKRFCREKTFVLIFSSNVCRIQYYIWIFEGR